MMAGNEILQLLESIDTKLMPERVQKLYQSAYEQRLSDPERALEDSRKALEEIGLSSRTVFDNSMTRTHARGKFYLLMASIHLNAATETEWQEAEKNYLLSKEEFRRRGWSHLAGLASLGLAMARRKLGKFEAAMNACGEAQNSLEQESIPSFINLRALRVAIEEEYSLIQETRGRFSRTPGLREKVLPVFYILAGEGRIAGRRSAQLNLLSRDDYERYTLRPVEEVIIDLNKCPSAENADYILEIDAQAKTEGDLKPGDWLLIQAYSTPTRLHGKTVAILIEEGQGTIVGLRTCIKAEDHYFLKAKDRMATSILINNKPSLWGVANFEALYYGERKVIRHPDTVPVSGPVVEQGHVSEQTSQTIRKGFLWRMIPRVSQIAAGPGSPIASEYIRDYVDLREDEPRGDGRYFILVVEGDSMSGDGIFSGDSVLIRQQEGVENGDIAAVVINTPDLEEPLGTLKRYYSYERKGREHWFLRSSNPTAQHLVVVPPDTDVAQIRRMYAKLIQAGKISLYENAELSIAGKYIKVEERNLNKTKANFIDMRIPSNAVERLLSHLQSNDAKLHSLGVSKVILEREPGEFEEWVAIISHLAAELGYPIASENIVEYLHLGNDAGKDVHFGLIVMEDSMKDDGMLPGDIALIRQQTEVENGDIAAMVITTPDLEEPLGTLKRYYSYERKGREHWFLRSSNPTAQHLVVVPPDTDVAQIRRMYAKLIQAGKISLYENAELSIAGKYVGLARKN
jgi:SOS-response transcriptional repressor LexA